MTKICIVYTVMVMFLAACGGNGKSSGGDAAPGKPNPPASADFSPFYMQTKTECAGYRRYFQELNGSLALPDGNAVWVRLQLDQAGKYRLIYQEQPSGRATPRTVSVTDGDWQAAGAAIELKGEAAGRLTVTDRKLELTALKAPKATLTAPGQPMRLTAQKVENDRVIVQCSPKDNPEMTVSGGQMMIQGKPAIEFWTKRLWLEDETDWKRRHPNVGETRGAGNVLSRVEVRVYKEGTFTIKKITGIQGAQGEAGGTWKIVEGLMVLGEIGVITPHNGGRVLEPLLYLNIDPVTKKPVEGAMEAFNIGARGL